MSRPEPSWWAEARRLRAEGEREGRPWTVSALAVHLGKSEHAVLYAVDPDLRERECAGNRSRMARRRAADSDFRERQKLASRQWRARRKAERIAAE